MKIGGSEFTRTETKSYLMRNNAVVIEFSEDMGEYRINKGEWTKATAGVQRYFEENYLPKFQE